MKKQYIKPENTIVEIQVGTLIAQSPEIPQGVGGNGDNAGSREVLIQDNIQAPDAWEMWE